MVFGICVWVESLACAARSLRDDDGGVMFARDENNKMVVEDGEDVRFPELKTYSVVGIRVFAPSFRHNAQIHNGSATEY